MLSFERPGCLWLLLALAPVILLYFLRMRFRRKSVGSIYLWRDILGQTSGGDALKRRALLLLALQILIVLALSFAASGPSISSSSLVKPGVAFLVDVSASMGALDGDASGSSSRVEAAVRAADREIEALGDEVPIMAFACSAGARPLLGAPTTDKRAAEAALRGLRALQEGFFETDCAESLSAWLSRASGAWSARLFTDGGLDLGGSRIGGAFGGEIGVSPIGSRGDSLGVSGLRLEASTASFNLWNGGSAAAALRVQLRRGQEVLASERLEAEPGWTRRSLGLDAPLSSGNYSLSADPESAGLPGAPGSTCYLAVNPTRPVSVLLVGREDPFLKAALAYQGISCASLPSFPPRLAARATRGASDSFEAPDVAIVESAAVPAGATCHVLSFGSPPAQGPVASGPPASGPISSARSAHQLSRFVDWEGAYAEAATSYVVRGQAEVLATIGGAPVLVAWEEEGYKRAVCGIDLSRSDLGLKSAFPILLQNFLQWCVPRTDDQGAYTLVVGEETRRSTSPTFSVKGPVEARRLGPYAILKAREAGSFEWSDGSLRGFLAANIPASELEATPRRVEALEGRSRSGAGGAVETHSALGSAERRRESRLETPAIAILVALIAAEALVWKGGLRRRKNGGEKVA
jgi:Aerotolerance regulator N-terminal.